MWIDAKEALPESLCIAQYKNEYEKVRTVMAKYIKARTMEYWGDYEEWADYDEETDTYWLPAGWYEKGPEDGEYEFSFIEEEVFRWMKIPD